MFGAPELWWRGALANLLIWFDLKGDSIEDGQSARPKTDELAYVQTDDNNIINIGICGSQPFKVVNRQTHDDVTNDTTKVKCIDTKNVCVVCVCRSLCVLVVGTARGGSLRVVRRHCLGHHCAEWQGPGKPLRVISPDHLPAIWNRNYDYCRWIVDSAFTDFPQFSVQPMWCGRSQLIALPLFPSNDWGFRRPAPGSLRVPAMQASTSRQSRQNVKWFCWLCDNILLGAFGQSGNGLWSNCRPSNDLRVWKASARVTLWVVPYMQASITRHDINC